MKTVAVVLATIAVKAVAGAWVEVKDFFPECSVECIEKSKAVVKDCDQQDSFCLCKHANYEAIYLDAYDCVVDACGFDKAEDEVLAAAEPYCEAATSAYAATATGPIPTDETDHDHDEEEEGEDHDHDHDAESSAASPTPSSAPVSSPATTSAAKETSAAASASEADATPAATSATVSAVPTGGAAQLGGMGAAAVIAVIAAL